jgi:two-component system, OmpR family, KDP operon response regulator KdpE
MNKPEILIIDDEEQIQKLLKITLETNDYKVSDANNAKHGVRIARTINPSLILLDLGLPDEHGIIVLKKLREWYTKPIIILSVQNEEENIVQALDLGANDYLTKPFRTGELLARLRTALRANKIMLREETIADLQIDFESRSVKRNGDILKLTSTEYDLLELLAKNEGRVLTHKYLLKEVWGPGYIDQSQYLRVFINQLRKKIEPDFNRPVFILTESGVGYRLVSKNN